MQNLFLNLLGKSISLFSKIANIGSGSTWPGHIALIVNSNYIKEILINSPTQVILIAGTNGKTTTGKILATILEKNKKTVFQNTSGANLLNGIASSLLLHSNLASKFNYDYAIFEIDENNLPLVLRQLTPRAIIVLDLFRDQLDRYGELDAIAKNWQKAFEKLPQSTQLILNADDPLIAYLGLSSQPNRTIYYFGLETKNEKSSGLQHAADSIYCPRCSNKLDFQNTFYSHLGIWKCPSCRLKRPNPNLSNSFYPLEGNYNKYNTLAAVLISQSLRISEENIQKALHSVTPAFGRQERLIINEKHIQIFLSKNPTSFNETLKTISEKGAKHVMFVLNDRIPDGRDVSWIWDIDFEPYIEKFKKVFVSGDRVYDMALRIKYSSKVEKYNDYNTYNNYSIEPNLKLAIKTALNQTPTSETLYILPTYSAMLEVRKILTGKKIL